MKSTSVTTTDLQSKELAALGRYLDILGDERAEQLRISTSPFRSKLRRIQAKKEVFRLDQEIEAKKNYLNEIKDSNRMMG